MKQCLAVFVSKGNMVPSGAIQEASCRVSSITCSCNTWITTVHGCSSRGATLYSFALCDSQDHLSHSSSFNTTKRRPDWSEAVPQDSPAFLIRTTLKHFWDSSPTMNLQWERLFVVRNFVFTVALGGKFCHYRLNVFHNVEQTDALAQL